MKLFFCMQINIQVYFNTLSVKISYKLILSLLMGMVKHSQSTQINKFAISLPYLKKEVRGGFFCIQINNKVSTSQHYFDGSDETWPKFAKQEFGNIFAISSEKSFATAFVLYCDAKHLYIFRGSNHVFILLLTFCWYEQVKDCMK